MKLAITGAAGFLGRYTVAEALRRGHQVQALVRPGRAGAGPWAHHDRLTIIEHDLLDDPARLVPTLTGADAVIHLAAKAGASEATLTGTRNLLRAMDAANPRRLVAISSFSVYDYQGLAAGQMLDEATPLESHPQRRDAYAQAKLQQEQLVRDHAASHGWICATLRPGAIYGKDRLWTARLGQPLSSRLWLRIGQTAELPLTYVENCAQAIVQAAESNQAADAVLNVVDDACPTQRSYAIQLRRQLKPRPLTLVVPRFAGQFLAGAANLTNKTLFRGRARVPSLLVPARFDARFKPLRYSNARIKAVLGWQPRYSLAEALARCTMPEAELLAVHPGEAASPVTSPHS